MNEIWDREMKPIGAIKVIHKGVEPLLNETVKKFSCFHVDL